MAHKITMPASGQNAAEAMITCWRVQEGDTVERGDVLFEIETDKAVMEVESFAKGTVLKILYEEGDMVEAGSVVAYIGEAGEAVEDTQQEVPAHATAAQETEPEETETEKALPTETVSTPQVLQASPAARKLAKENNVALQQLYEELGRPIKVADVAAYCAADEADYEVVKPSGMRRVIAKRMLQSTSEAPQFTVTVKIDMTNMIQMREQINAYLAEKELKVSFNDLLTKCVCAAVKKYPLVNGQYTSEDEIRIMRHTNVGIAVALPDGLVVPVIQQADTLSVQQIAMESKRLIAAAKDRTLQANQMNGGTVTISNLGMYGIDSFTALVNRPESAILAVGAIVQTPVVYEGEITVRPIMKVTASFDHRLIDGGVGALFMAELKKLVENPISILI